MRVKLLLLALLLGTTASLADDTSTKLQSVDLKPYEKESYPNLYRRYGTSFVLNEIQKARVEAANAMAAEEKCDRVMWSEYSDTSTKRKIVVYVDCANGYRNWYEGGKVVKTAQNEPFK